MSGEMADQKKLRSEELEIRKREIALQEKKYENEKEERSKLLGVLKLLASLAKSSADKS